MRRALGARVGEPLSGGNVALVVAAERDDGTPAVLKVSLPASGERPGGRRARLLGRRRRRPRPRARPRARGAPPRAARARDDAWAAGRGRGDARRGRRAPPSRDRARRTGVRSGCWRDAAREWAERLPGGAARGRGAPRRPDPQVLLHQDLHGGNVLRHGGDWVAIDPKPLVGDPAFDVASLVRDRRPIRDRSVVARRLDLLADGSGTTASGCASGRGCTRSRWGWPDEARLIREPRRTNIRAWPGASGCARSRSSRPSTRPTSRASASRSTQLLDAGVRVLPLRRRRRPLRGADHDRADRARVDRGARPRARRRDRRAPHGGQPGAPHPADGAGRRRLRHVPRRGDGRPGRADRARARARPRRRRRLQPGDRGRPRGRGGGGRRPLPLHVDQPGLLGPGVHARGAAADPRAPRARSRPTSSSRSTAASATATSAPCTRPAPRCSSPAARSSAARICHGLPAARPSPRVSLERALELAAAAAGRAYPNPTVGAVVVAGGEIVGEGVTEEHGGRHGEVVALDAAGERARGATLYLTMEPCTHHGRTPPCVDGSSRPGSRASSRAPSTRTPRPAAAWSACARRAWRSSSWTRGRPGARTRPGGRGSRLGRPFVTYKVGGHARRPRHRARIPLGDRRGEPAPRPRAARRLGRRRGRRGHRSARTRRGSTPATSPSAPAAAARLRTRPAAPDTSSSCDRPARRGARAPRRGGRAVAPARRRADARDGVPRADLVDKLLLFVAPVLAAARARAGSASFHAGWARAT